MPSKKYYDNNKEKYKQEDKDNYLKNKDQILIRRKNYYQENKQKVAEYNKLPHVRYNRMKHQVKRREIEFSISLDDWNEIQSLPCYYCSNELGTKTVYSSGLDRLNNCVGYTRENCVSCCFTCNRIKGDNLSPQETKIAINAIINFRKGFS